MKKREISDIEKEECKRLKQIFNDRKKELGLSQEKIAGLIGVTQAAINHYLNGTNALNLIPTDILLSRLNPDYNIHQSKQR